MVIFYILNREEYKMKKKCIIFLFFLVTIVILVANIVMFTTDLYYTPIGRYISIFNIVALSIEGLLYLYLNKPIKKR